MKVGYCCLVGHLGGHFPPVPILKTGLLFYINFWHKQWFLNLFHKKPSVLTQLFWPTVFYSDLWECNNSNDSDLWHKVIIREAGQGTISLDRLLICHSYCCGYCMTGHVLSSSSPLTFMFHLVSLLFLRVVILIYCSAVYLNRDN